MLNVYVELSKGCPSTSWVLAIMNGGILKAARMSAASQKEVFSKGVPRAAGASAPTEQAHGVAGGYVVSGAWAGAMVPMVRPAGIGVLIGMLEGLLEVVIGDNSKRPLVQTKFQRKTDSAVFAASIGEAASKIFTAKALMEKAMSKIDALAVEKCQMSYSNRARKRGFAALSVRLLREAADGLVDALGSSGFLTANPGQRY
jgi:hypothetical protein